MYTVIYTVMTVGNKSCSAGAPAPRHCAGSGGEPALNGHHTPESGDFCSLTVTYMSCCYTPKNKPPRQRQSCPETSVPIHLPHQVKYHDRIGYAVEILVEQGTLSIRVVGRNCRSHKQVTSLQWDEDTCRLQILEEDSSFSPEDSRSFSPVPVEVDVSWIRTLADAAQSPKCDWQITKKQLPLMAFPYRILTATGDVRSPDGSDGLVCLRAPLSPARFTSGGSTWLDDTETRDSITHAVKQHAAGMQRELVVQKGTFVAQGSSRRVKKDSTYNDTDSDDERSASLGRERASTYYNDGIPRMSELDEVGQQH